jgi:hypothetical protein
MALPKKRPERWSSEPSIQVVQEAPLKQSNAGVWEFALRQPQWMVRVAFWLLGLVLASLQSWSFRHFVTADAIAYLDMSDFVVRGAGWQRIISGVWSPLYPFLIGVGRLILRPSPSGEIATCHLFNIVIFIFAFVCFEFLMRNLLRDSERIQANVEKSFVVPTWAYQILGYSLFLWASISQITMQSLRPDMLMSGFIYLAMGLLLGMRGRTPNWKTYTALGTVLGVGYLEKAPMLPLGILMLLSSLAVVTNWRRALPMALWASALFLVIGSLYFVPLSIIRGHFTFGESSSYNYLFHVDHAGPTWYMQDIGHGAGKFLYSPLKIFAAPPAYEFSIGQPVTHPLRLDPAYWTQGARPRFHVKDQFWTTLENIDIYSWILAGTGGLIVGFLILCFVAERKRDVLRDILRQWPVWLPGIFALGMYALIHVENRYTGVFFVLLWLGLFYALHTTIDRRQRIKAAVMLGIAASLILPTAWDNSYDFVRALRNRTDPDRTVVMELGRLGIHAGDRVARISPFVIDLGWAREARVTIIAEVDWESANDFWTAGGVVQDQVLQALAGTGAKIVVAHLTGRLAPPGWQRLGTTQFWAHALEPHRRGE